MAARRMRSRERLETAATRTPAAAPRPVVQPTASVQSSSSGTVTRGPGSPGSAPRRRRRGRRGARRIFAATLFLVVIVAGGVTASTHADFRPRPQRPRAVARPAPRAVRTPGPDQLALTSKSWSMQAQQAITGIQNQLTELGTVYEKALAVPPQQRTTQLRRAIEVVSDRMAELRQQEAALQVGLAAQDLYSRSSAQLANVQREISALKQTEQGTSQAGTPADGVGSAVEMLGHQENTLISQVGTWKNALLQAMNQPLSVAPTITSHIDQITLTAVDSIPPTPPVTAQPPAVIPVPFRKGVPQHFAGQAAVPTAPRTPVAASSPGTPEPAQPVVPVPVTPPVTSVPAIRTVPVTAPGGLSAAPGGVAVPQPVTVSGQASTGAIPGGPSAAAISGHAPTVRQALSQVGGPAGLPSGYSQAGDALSSPGFRWGGSFCRGQRESRPAEQKCEPRRRSAAGQRRSGRICQRHGSGEPPVRQCVRWRNDNKPAAGVIQRGQSAGHQFLWLA